MTRYIKVKTTEYEETDLKVNVYYSLGGMNCFSYKSEPRGYYISIGPVNRYVTEDGVKLESFLFSRSGFKVLLKEVTRKSAKAESEAQKKAEEMIDELVQKACAMYNLEVAW